MSRIHATEPVLEIAIASPICDRAGNDGAAGTAVTPITSSGQGWGGPGGGARIGVAEVGVTEVVADEEAVTVVTTVDGGEEAAATALGGTTGSVSSLIRAPTSHTSSSSATTAMTMAATRLRQYTEDGSGPCGSNTWRRYPHQVELSGNR